MIDINDFIQEKSCIYKGEEYLVRDNGAILRKPHEGKRTRPLDNQWTFGTKNVSNGYMTLGNHRVHIIVATAFHGERDSKVYVVDHIDTNRCNNRVDNLRWLTRLENILLNEITRNKIEYICGSVENFLKDPTLLRGHEYEDRNFEWMRTVSKQEAENTLKNWNNLLLHPKEKSSAGITIGDWIYSKPTTPSKVNIFPPEFPCSNIFSQAKEKKTQNVVPSVRATLPTAEHVELGYKTSLTPNAYQDIAWKTPTEFPLCPTEGCDIEKYFRQLVKGSVFSKNQYGESLVSDAAIFEGSKIAVKCYMPDGIKSWSLAVVEINDEKFVHESISTYFNEDGANKYFTLIQGKEWSGGEVFDDYC